VPTAALLAPPSGGVSRTNRFSATRVDATTNYIRLSFNVRRVISCLVTDAVIVTTDIAFYLFFTFPSGWTTSSAEAVHQLRPNAQPQP